MPSSTTPGIPQDLNAVAIGLDPSFDQPKRVTAATTLLGHERFVVVTIAAANYDLKLPHLSTWKNKTIIIYVDADATTNEVTVKDYDGVDVIGDNLGAVNDYAVFLNVAGVAVLKLGDATN